MARIYNFAIVRVSPDPRRGELVNIGIIVFLPHTVDVQILPSLAKVQALHGELDLAELHSLPQRLADFARQKRSVADRYTLLRRVGMVELSEIGQFSAAGNEDYERVTERLISRLVRPTAAIQEREATTSSLYMQVRKIIKEVKLLGRKPEDINNHKIVSRYALAPEKNLYADFVGKNSVYYFTETIDFRVDRGILGTKFNESAKAALVLRESQHRHSDSKRIVMYAASAAMETRVQPHLRVLEEFATDFVNYESTRDRAAYVQRLATALGGQLPIKAPQN